MLIFYALKIASLRSIPIVLDVQHDSRPVSEVVHQCPLVTHGEVNDGVDNPADRLKVHFSPSRL
jgi:hypothetical protein